MAEKKKTLEQTLEELEELLDRMDSGEVSLEESFSLYQQGVKLVKKCNDKIDRIEKQILILRAEDEDGGTKEL